MQHLGYDLSANVSLLWTEYDYLDRFAAAADAGFAFVETWWPFPAAEPTVAQEADLLRSIEAAGVRLRGLNLFAGDMPSGERGIVTNAARRPEFMANLAAVTRIAEATGCDRFNLLYGQLTDDEDPTAQHAAAQEAVAIAAAALGEGGGVVLIEPLAAGLNGAYPLHTHEDVIALLDGPFAGVAGVGLLFDTFHLAMNGVDVVAAVERSGARIAHVQIADAPGRGEPGSGDLAWDEVFAALRAAGYAGPAAAEYRPTVRTEDSLAWVRP
ncbi:xylose isomerase [Occultella glacieicola]|uniref:Xylose isomerase n=1 Tax=Occultella glacieicola TaxID=2518684 RepID=A0ABY2E0N9_9MICO|nr:TIM barrel protein [Occultella glacieicola]TDE91505.1 xylose isomerase [Occultella glacieicola]